jgi:IS5 family transposase
VRRRIPKQAVLFSPVVDSDLARDLAGIDALVLAHPVWVEWVHADLTKSVDATSGREGMPASQVLRVRLAQACLDMSLRRFAPCLADWASLRDFVGIGPFDRAPSRSTLQENQAKVSPETWGRILRSVVTSEEARAVESAEKVRVDATVIRSNIHTPSDSSLLWDCVRVLTRLLTHAWSTFGLDFEDQSRAAKKLQSRIFYARKKEQRAPAYRELLAACERVGEQVGRVVSGLRRVEPRRVEDLPVREQLLRELPRVQGLLARVMRQTTRRVIEGESVPAAEKVLSIFELHTDLIVKSGNRPPEYGHKVTITAGASGLVLDCVIEDGNPGDVSVAVRQLERQKALFGKAPRAAAFDGAYASRENLEQAKALGVERVAFSRGRGLTAEEMAGNRRAYGRLRRFRAGVEATISRLKRAFGLDRCTWKGAQRFAAYVWSAVVAANLILLARARLCAG